MSKKNISRLAFGIILVGFFLPFVSVTFLLKLTLSGFQLIMGDKTYLIPSYTAAVFAMLSAICGLGASFIDEKKSAIATVIVSVIGVIALLSLGGDLTGGLTGKLVSMQFGYYMNILLFAAAGVVSILDIKEKSDGKFENIFSFKVNCPKCGAVISGKDEFCGNCGNITKNTTFDSKVTPNLNHSPEQFQEINSMNIVGVSSQPILRGIAGQHSGKSYSFDGAKLILGRDAGICNVVFAADAPGISRIHCEVNFDAAQNSFILLDRGSSYGTFLASKLKLTNGQPYILASGESFYLASEANMFEVNL